ncbi:MAG: succinate dehydrogenase assembly factor 2 [Burkholderiaceae bacterium]
MQDTPAEPLLDERGLSRLIWRCRRGMLENDLFLERFLRTFGGALTVRQADSLSQLMALADNDLLDLHLGRRQLTDIDPALVRSDMIEILGMLRKYR